VSLLLRNLLTACCISRLLGLRRGSLITDLQMIAERTSGLFRIGPMLMNARGW
jgi:hypothetical protein